MDQPTFNLFYAILSCISLVATIGGLYAVYIQIVKIKETTWSNTHNKLADQSLELLKFLSQNPSTYEYFYKNKPLEQESTDKYIVLFAAEALSNFMENLLLQKNNLPDKQWAVWNRFIYTTFEYSIVVRNFIQENREWYCPELLEIADKCEALFKTRSQIASTDSPDNS